MLRRKVLPVLAAAVLPASFLTLGAMAPAHAEPLPTDYSASAVSSILSTDVTAVPLVTDNVLGLPGTISADVGLASAAADSTAAVKTVADGANVAAGAVGLSVELASGHSEQPAGPATDDWTALAVDLSPVADVGVISGTTAANWAGDAACVPDGTPLSSSTTTLADADLLALPTILGIVPPITGASLTTAVTTSSTALVDNGAVGDVRNVVSTATASLAGLSLLSDAVQVEVVGDATLTSTATGTAGTTETVYTPPTINVTALGATQSLALGVPVNLSIPIVPGIADATVTLTMNDLADNDSGLTAAGEVSSVFSIDVVVNALGNPVLTSSLELFPLSTSATAPTGGVECVLPPPAITSPADGDWTGPTPTIEGTGVPGATVDVVIDGNPVGTATVGDDGTWSFPVTDALAPGVHDVVATQTLDGTTSAESNNPTFNVAAAPVITAPADGSSTADDTPAIEGTGQPDTEIEVFVDGASIGTTTVDAEGNWTLTPTTPLAPGEHTVDATQSGPEGLVQEAAQVTFTVTLSAPVITSPDDGSSTDDTTPTVEGDGAPGATVTVVIDGEVVGTTQVGDDGTWTLELSEALACGEHTVTATQELGGVVSPASAPVTFTITCAQGGPDAEQPTTTPATADALPDTGAPGGMVAIALLGLTLMGAGGLLLRRMTA